MSDDYKIVPDMKDEAVERRAKSFDKARLRAQVAELREGLMAGIEQTISILELLKVRVDYDHFKIWEDDDTCRKACELFDHAEELLAYMSGYPDKEESEDE